MAVLVSEIGTTDDGWYQLLPAGFFKAVDGRPLDVPGGQWYLDATIAQRLIDQVEAAANDLVIDYEHQTLRKDENGKPAPAAGWFKDIEWREGSGLWIKPRWTERAKTFVSNGEYRYLSAVFPYDATTGYPLKLHSAALTNRAGVDGMQALADLNASDLNPNHQEKAMNELLKQMLKALGITVTGEAALSEEDQSKALTALNDLKTKAGTADTLATQVAELSAKDTAPDPAKYVPIAVADGLRERLAALGETSVEAEIHRLLKDNETRIYGPADEEWHRDYGMKHGVAALSERLKSAKPIAALSGMQTNTQKPDTSTDPLAALTAEDLEAAKLLGKTPEQFAALKAEQAKA